MDAVFWIAAVSVAGSLTVLAVVFWAVTDFLVALGRYVLIYRNVGSVRNDLIKFAREIAKARRARCERARAEGAGGNMKEAGMPEELQKRNFLAAGEKNQDSTALAGDIDYRKIANDCSRRQRPNSGPRWPCSPQNNVGADWRR